MNHINPPPGPRLPPGTHFTWKKLTGVNSHIPVNNAVSYPHFACPSAPASRVPPTRRPTTMSTLSPEQQQVMSQLTDMGMDRQHSQEAATIGLNIDLAVTFCMDEDVRKRERDNHKAVRRWQEVGRHDTRGSSKRQNTSSASSGAVAPVPAPAAAAWQWQADDNAWHSFDPAAAAQISASNGLGGLTLQLGGVLYNIDLNALTQTRVNGSRYCRKICQGLLPPAMPAPALGAPAPPLMPPPPSPPPPTSPPSSSLLPGNRVDIVIGRRVRGTRGLLPLPAAAASSSSSALPAPVATTASSSSSSAIPALVATTASSSASFASAAAGIHYSPLAPPWRPASAAASASAPHHPPIGEHLTSLLDVPDVDAPPDYWGVGAESGFSPLECPNMFVGLEGTLPDGYMLLEAQVLVRPLRFKQYQMKRQEMILDLTTGGLNEQWAWHGTAQGNIDGIAENGICRDYNHVSVFGKGSYFARDITYSLRPAYASPNAQGEQHLLLCRVLRGESCVGNPSMSRPRAKPGRSKLYDSMVDVLDDPSVIVLSTGSDSQCYPEFLLKVKRRV